MVVPKFAVETRRASAQTALSVEALEPGAGDTTSVSVVTPATFTSMGTAPEARFIVGD